MTITSIFMSQYFILVIFFLKKIISGEEKEIEIAN